MRTRMLLRVEDRALKLFDVEVDVARVVPEAAPAVHEVVIDLGGATALASEPFGRVLDSGLREIVGRINAESGLPAGMEIHLGAGCLLGVRAAADAEGMLRLRAVRPEAFPDGPEVDLDQTPLLSLLSDRQVEALSRVGELAA